MSEQLFESLGMAIAHHNDDVDQSLTGRRRFRSLFGTSPLICSIAWTLIQPSLPDGGEPKHLLWALLFMKTYMTEHAMRVLTGADEKTQRKWIWIFIDLLSSLNVVSTVGYS